MGSSMTFDVRQWSKESRNILQAFVRIILCLTCLAIAIAKFNRYGGEIITGWLFVASLCLFTIGGITWFAGTCDHDPAPIKIARHIRRSAQIAALLAAMSVMTFGETDSGAWINTANGESTMSSRIVFAKPFSNAVSFVPGAYAPEITVHLKTSDAIPLACAIDASGIYLEKERQGIERLLLSLGSGRPPEKVISSELSGAIAAAAGPSIERKTSSELQLAQRFAIPYQIGTPLGDTLHRLGLKWQDGEVSADCRVIFN